jgi:hypothetical protein
VFAARHDRDAEFELLVRALIDGLHARLLGGQVWHAWAPFAVRQQPGVRMVSPKPLTHVLAAGKLLALIGRL